MPLQRTNSNFSFNRKISLKKSWWYLTVKFTWSNSHSKEEILILIFLPFFQNSYSESWYFLTSKRVEDLWFLWHSMAKGGWSIKITCFYMTSFLSNTKHNLICSSPCYFKQLKSIQGTPTLIKHLYASLSNQFKVVQKSNISI